MTHFSAKLAVPLAVLLALALAGALYAHSLPERDECRDNQLLLDASAFDPPLTLQTEGRHPTDIERGRLIGIWPGSDEQPDPAVVGIVRTRGLPNVLLQPAAALPGRNEPDDLETGFLETGAGRIPVSYAYERRGREVRITAYAMGYRGEAIQSALGTRLVEGASAFAEGTWPITLFVAAAHGHLSRTDALRIRLDAWLREAWVHYRAVCSGDPPATTAALRTSDSPPR